MARTSKFVLIAEQRGYKNNDGTPDVRKMLVDQLNESGSLERAAVDLGIGYHHVVRKVNNLGIRKQPAVYE